MRLPRPLRLAAAILFFASAGTLTPFPASAQTTVTSREATVASVLTSLSPHLSLDKARVYARSILADAWRMHLDPKFIMSIVTVESDWHANAVSRVGAQGLGQLMPGTAAGLGVNPHNPADNLRGTSSYLKALLNRFAGKPNSMKLVIAGYNAGPKAVERYHGVPPYAETQRYVVKVLHVWNMLNSRVGLALRAAPTPTPTKHIASRTADEQQWLNSNITSVLPPDAVQAQPPAVDPTPSLQIDGGT